MCTGTNEHQNPGANSAESDFVFSAKERMGTSKYKSGDNLYILRGYLNKYESSHNDIWYMGCLIFCQLENPGPGIFLRNLQPKYIVGWKNENSRIDLYKQAYLIKEGRGRGDLTKYDTTFPFEDDQFNYLSKYQNQYF